MVSPAHPVAASALLHGVLGRPARRCRVVAASTTGVHVASGDADVPVLSLVVARGARLPGGCVLASGGDDRAIAQLGIADHLLVGDGSVAGPGVRVAVHRWWPMPDVRLPSAGATMRAGVAALTAATDPLRPSLPVEVGDVAARFGAGVAGRDAAEIRRTVEAMVGLGPGLTPAADDLIAGALLAWHHLGAGGSADAIVLSEIVGAAVRDRLDRTTSVSAALLHHAGRGESVPEALSVLDTVRRPETVAGAVAALVRVGQDTGRSVATGLAIGLESVLASEQPEKVAS